MAGNEKQKLKLLVLMDIFRQKTDEEHIMSASELCEELEKYDISAERKSIYKDIEVLKEYGLDIIYTRNPKNGYFLGLREFEDAEIRLLCDAVQAAAFIPVRKTHALLSKIGSLTSEHQFAAIKKQVYIDNRAKCTNEEIFYNIDLLGKAIAQNLQVSFVYRRQIVSDTGDIRFSDKSFTLSPYAMIWSDDHYYLVGNNAKYDNLMHARIDRIRKVEITDIPARHFSEVCDYKIAFDSADYAAKHFNMFSGTPETVTLLCSNSLLEIVTDHFGDGASLMKYDENRFTARAEAAVTTGLVSWIAQFGNQIKVLSPASLQEMVAERARQILEVYSN